MADLPDTVTLEDLDRVANVQREERRMENYVYPEFLLKQDDGQPIILEVPGTDGADSTFYVVTADMEATNSDFVLMEYNDLNDWRQNLWQTPNQFENTGAEVYRSTRTGEAIPADQVQEITVKIQQDGSAIIVPDDQVLDDYWTNNGEVVDSYEADKLRIAHRNAVEQNLAEGEFPTDPKKGELRTVQVALVKTQGLDLSVGSVISQEQLQTSLLDRDEYRLMNEIGQTNATTQPTQDDDRANMIETRVAHQALRGISREGVGEASSMINAAYVMNEARISFNDGPPVSFNPNQNAATIIEAEPAEAEVIEEQPEAEVDYATRVKLTQLENLENMKNSLPDALPADSPIRANLETQILNLQQELGIAEPAEKISPEPVTEAATSGSTRTIGDIAAQYEVEQAELAAQGFNAEGTMDYEPEPEYENTPKLMTPEQFAAGMNEGIEQSRPLILQELQRQQSQYPEGSPEYTLLKERIEVFNDSESATVSSEEMQQYLKAAQEVLPESAVNLQNALNSGDFNNVEPILQQQMQGSDIDIQAMFTERAGAALADPNLGLTAKQQEQVTQAMVQQYSGALQAVAEGRDPSELIGDVSFNVQNGGGIDTSDWSAAQIQGVNALAAEIVEVIAPPLVQQEIESAESAAAERLRQMEEAGVEIPPEVRERFMQPQ